MRVNLASIEDRALELRRDHAAENGELKQLKVPLFALDRTFSNSFYDGYFASFGFPIKTEAIPYSELKKDFVDYHRESMNKKYINKSINKIDKYPEKGLIFDPDMERGHQQRTDDFWDLPTGSLTKQILSLALGTQRIVDRTLIAANEHYDENRQIYIAMALAEAAERGIAISLSAGTQDAINVHTVEPQ